jgi:hypothetical protein
MGKAQFARKTVPVIALVRPLLSSFRHHNFGLEQLFPAPRCRRSCIGRLHVEEGAVYIVGQWGFFGEKIYRWSISSR